MIEKNTKIIIAMSGGPDSVALFHLLNDIKKEYNLELYFAHINHMLRGEESMKDEAFVEELGQKNEIKVYIKREDVLKYASEKKIGLEEAGRNVRYNFFEKLKNELYADKVALAHNMDDNVETFLFRMIRGSSLDGLASIPIKRDFYIRPLLDISKKDILEYLKINEFNYRIDESNNENTYTRNKIRNELIKDIENSYNPLFKDKINNLIKEIEVNNKIRKEYFQAIIETSLEDNSIIIENIKKVKTIERGYIIAEYLKNNNIEVSHNKVEEIVDVLYSVGAKEISLNKNMVLRKDYKKLYIAKRLMDEEKSTEKSVELFIGEEAIFNNYIVKSEFTNEVIYDKQIFCLDYDKLKSKTLFFVRGRVEGDLFVPTGMKVEKKLKNFFIDEKIDRFLRDQIPIVTNGEEIVWIAGYRGSERYKVDKDTKKIIKLSVREVQKIG